MTTAPPRWRTQDEKPTVRLTVALVAIEDKEERAGYLLLGIVWWTGALWRYESSGKLFKIKRFWWLPETELLETLPSEGRAMLNELLDAMRAMAIRSHYDCEDNWYSCPQAPDGCANDGAGEECICGADEHNLEVDRVYAEAKRLASNTE